MTNTQSQSPDTSSGQRATSKIAVLGDVDFVLPFSALGVDTFSVSQASDEITDVAKNIIDGKYALIVVAENIAPAVEQIFADLQNLPTPCIVVVPFTTESEGFATQALAKVLKLATGIDILQDGKRATKPPLDGSG